MNRIESIEDLLNVLEFLINEALEEFDNGYSVNAHKATQKAMDAIIKNEYHIENMTNIATVEKRHELADEDGWLHIANIGVGHEGEWIAQEGGYEFRINYH